MSREPWFSALRRRVGEFVWRLREVPKDYRYGGARAALRWIIRGEAADAND